MKIYDEKEIEKNIGLCIYVLRKESGMSARQLGSLIDKSECAVTAWERGEKTPSLSSLINLCNTFSCTVDELLIACKRLSERKNLSNAEPKNLQQRNEMIFKQHNDGLSMKKLSIMYNLHMEQISIICKREQDKVDKKENSLWQLICVENRTDISHRVYNCLRRKGIHTKDSLREVIDDLISGTIQCPNLGKGCRKYLEQIKDVV